MGGLILQKSYHHFSKIMIITLTASLTVPAINANAESLDTLKKQQQQVDQKKSNLISDIQLKSNKIQENKLQQDQFMNQIKKLDQQIIKTDEKISVLSSKIEVSKKEVRQLNASIQQLEKSIQEREDLLKDRARAIQENGHSINYIDVLLGANSFADFIDRISAVTTLVEADHNIIQAQFNDKKKLAVQQKKLKQKLKKQQENYHQLKSLKTELDQQKLEKNKLIDQLEKTQKELISEKDLKEKEYSETLSISKDVQNNIEKEQARLTEIARQQAEAKKTNTDSTSSSPSTSESATTQSTPSVSSGTWTRPTTGRITSNSGVRDIGAGAEVHYGLDIANAEGTPIVAAADGVVFRASPLSTYGNVIMITHSINGQTYTTVYAHLSGYKVHVGQSVKKGQLIGYMGSTGRSTGSHLHFEMHDTPWQGQKVGLINPLRYISF